MVKKIAKEELTDESDFSSESVSCLQNCKDHDFPSLNIHSLNWLQEHVEHEPFKLLENLAVALDLKNKTFKNKIHAL